MARKSEDSATKRTPNASGWVKAFVVFHLIAIAVWTVPTPSQALESGTDKPRGSDRALLFNERVLKSSPIRFYVLSTGFWQYWDLFAPNPATIDIWCDADVVYRNGSVKTYKYPRMAQLSNGQKFVKERFRKYYERVSVPQSSFLWPSFAQRIAFVSDNSIGNPPVAVRLYHHWREVAAPGSVQPEEYNRRLLFTYLVDQDALKKARDEWPK